MKKWILAALLGCSVFLAGCGKKDAEELPLGSYQMEYERAEEEGVIFLPTIVLREDHEFSFTASLASSYLYMGNYEIQDGELILSEEPEFGEWECRFRIEGQSLVFDKENSSEIMTFMGDVPVEDGAVFVLEEEEEE